MATTSFALWWGEVAGRGPGTRKFVVIGRWRHERSCRAVAGRGEPAGCAGRGGLSGRRAPRHGLVPRRQDEPADLAGGRAGRGQDRGGEGAGRRARYPADPVAVL